ncbi:MAG TPA: DUF11 domain-containing protein, partial [Acidimicrobiales bacterium]
MADTAGAGGRPRRTTRSRVLVAAASLAGGLFLIVSPQAAKATPVVNLAISLLADGASSETVNAGQTVTFDTTVTNTGPSDATGVSVSELLPAGLTFGGASPGGVYDATTGAWAIGSLPAGTSMTLAIVATVTGTSPSITTTATASATDASTVTSSATVDLNADVGVAETVSAGDSVLPGAIGSATVNAGQDVTYQISAFNNGAATATNVVVTDELPANFTLNNGSVTPSLGAFTVSGGVLTWTISSLPAGATDTLSYTETVNAPSAIDTNVTAVSVTSTQTDTFGDATPQDNGDSGSVEVLPLSNLSITNSDGTTSVIPGTSDTYTVTLANTGPSSTINATVIDTIPTGFTVTGNTSSVGGVTFTNLGTGVVEWTGVDLAGGDVANFTLTGAVDPNLSAGRAFVNLAQVTLPAGQLDSNVVAIATDSDNVHPTADVSIEQTDSGNLVNGTFSPTTNDTTGAVATPGSSDVYTVVLSNGSTQSTATNLSLSDNLPPSVTSAAWSVTSTTGGASATVSSGTTTDISDSLTLPAGSSVTFTIDANIAPGATGALVNTATLTLPPQFTDTNAFTSSTDVAALAPQSDLSITNSDGVTSLTPGTTDTYTVTVSNTGPSDAVGLGILDTLPPGFTNFTSSGTLPAGVTFSVSSGTATWSGVNVASGQTVTLMLSGLVPTAATGTFVNTATVVVPPGTTDTNSTTTVTDSDSLVPQADVSIVVTDGYNTTAGTFSPATNNTSGGSVTAGTSFAYTVVVSNAGPSDAAGLTVGDTLPTGVTSDDWVATTSAGASVTSGGSSGTGKISDTVDMPSGSSITYIIDAVVSSSATGTLSDTATVTSPSGLTDTNAFTSSTDTQTVTSSANNGMPNADLALTTTDNAGGTFQAQTNDTHGGAGVPGDTIDYTVVVSNGGPTAATGVGVSDIVAPGVSADTWSVTSTSGGAVDVASGTGDISDTVTLPANSSVTYTIDATIAPGATSVLVNTATITTPSTINDTNSFTQSLDLVTLTPESDLSITNSDGVTSLTPGTTDTYTVTVSNTGPSDAVDLAILDTLPPGFADVASTGTLPAGVTFSVSSGTAAWSGVNVGSGQTVTLKLSGFVPTGATGTFVNTATVAVPPGSTDTNSTTTVTDSDTLAPQANLAISVLADGTSSETVNAGQVVTYTIGLSNSGPSAATNVQVQDILSADTDLDFNLSSAVVSGGVLSTAGGNITWNLASLADGGSATLTIVATVTGTSPSITTTATASATDASTVTSSATVDLNADVGVA